MKVFRTHQASIVASRLVALACSLLMLCAMAPWCCLVESGHHNGTGVTATASSRPHGAMEHLMPDSPRATRAPTDAKCAFGLAAPQARADDSSIAPTRLRWTLYPALGGAVIFDSSKLAPPPHASRRPPPSPILALETPPPRAS